MTGIYAAKFISSNKWTMSDFIWIEFLGKQVESIMKISGYITNLKRVGPGHSEYHFDHETLDQP